MLQKKQEKNFVRLHASVGSRDLEAVILTINKDIVSVSICKRFFKPFHLKLVVGVESVRPLVAHVTLKKTQ